MKSKTFFKEAASKSVAELQRELAAKREQVRDLRFKASQNQLKTVRVLRKLKQEISQILTAVKSKSQSDTTK